MKIGVQCKVNVVGKNKREYKRNDGTAGVAYTVAIMQDGQCANIACSEDVFNDVLLDPAMPIDIDVYMFGTVDEQYKSFKFDKVVKAEHIKHGSVNK